MMYKVYETLLFHYIRWVPALYDKIQGFFLSKLAWETLLVSHNLACLGWGPSSGAPSDFLFRAFEVRMLYLSRRLGCILCENMHN